MTLRWLALGLALASLSCSEPPAPGPRAAPVPQSEALASAVPPNRCAEGVASLPSPFLAGMSLAHNYQGNGRRGYGSETSRETMDTLVTLGVRELSLTPFGFMRSTHASDVTLATDHPAGETDARMEAAIRDAHARGLAVFLKPHVWISGGAWRGEIEPALGWEAFFTSYSRFVLHYARMAARLEVERFAVGVEIPSAATSEWRALIRAVRAVYSGQITYAANWDAVDRVAFWSDVDFIGVQFYPSLAEARGADEASMQRALEGQLDALGALSRRVERPVLLTEVGYKSIEDTELRPHQWPERHGAPVPSEAAQARAYRRLFNAVAARPFVRGLYLWKWFTDPDTHEEGADGFSPRGKQAEAILRAAFASGCRG
ncbi:MAG: hypothetical protein AB8I08_00415 [Sandaracinaceae bacterium]